MKALFELSFVNKPFAILAFSDGVWLFKYLKSFDSIGINPIINFPNTKKVYKSKHLFPFFKSRIPWFAKGMQEVKALIKYGRRCAANPYTLIVREVIDD